MADNVRHYGFKWVGSKAGACTEKPLVAPVASGYQAVAGAGGDNVDLRIGDPVHRLSTGYVELAAGAEGTPDNLLGIIVGIKQYWDGSVLRKGDRVPGATAYGTVLQRRTMVEWVPAVGNIFEINCDDASTATTLAAYLALVGENADHILPRDVTDSSRPKADPFLDISSHATTQGLQWRILGFRGLEREDPAVDFSGNYVTAYVTANETEEAPGAVLTTGV